MLIATLACELTRSRSGGSLSGCRTYAADDMAHLHSKLNGSSMIAKIVIAVLVPGALNQFDTFSFRRPCSRGGVPLLHPHRLPEDLLTSSFSRFSGVNLKRRKESGSLGCSLRRV